MGEMQQFPDTFTEFIDQYSFRDKDAIYTSNAELIPTFRVKQGYAYYIDKVIGDVRSRDESILEIWSVLDELFKLSLNKEDVPVELLQRIDTLYQFYIKDLQENN